MASERYVDGPGSALVVRVDACGCATEARPEEGALARQGAVRPDIDTDKPMVVEHIQNGEHHTVSPNVVADAQPRNPTPCWSAR